MITGEPESVDRHGPSAMDIYNGVDDLILIVRIAPSGRIMNTERLGPVMHAVDHNAISILGIGRSKHYIVDLESVIIVIVMVHDMRQLDLDGRLVDQVIGLVPDLDPVLVLVIVYIPIDDRLGKRLDESFSRIISSQYNDTG